MRLVASWCGAGRRNRGCDMRSEQDIQEQRAVWVFIVALVIGGGLLMVLGMALTLAAMM